MRRVTVAAVVVVLAAIGAAVTVGVFGLPGDAAGSVSMEERWISDTAREGEVNHHSPVAGVVDGRPMVYVPLSAGSEDGSCALVALDAVSAEEIWQYPVPDERCTVHAVADPTIADHDGDGEREVMVATTESAMHAFGAISGERELRYDLAAYGYSEPVVADLTGDGSNETLLVDARGTAYAIRPNGSTIWTRDLEAYVWATPVVADFDGDGAPGIAVAGEGGTIELLDRNGTARWNRSALLSGSVTTLVAGNLDDDPAIELVATSDDGEVVALDGATGDVEWTRDVGALAAVSEVARVDGAAMVYAVARDGRLRALDAATGEPRWETTLTTADVQMMPAPRLGDVDGDDDLELVSVTNDGLVTVVDPSSGDVLDTYRRDVTIWTSPALADVDGDGSDEVFVLYGDGRVVALSHETSE